MRVATTCIFKHTEGEKKKSWSKTESSSPLSWVQDRISSSLGLVTWVIMDGLSMETEWDSTWLFPSQRQACVREGVGGRGERVCLFSFFFKTKKNQDSGLYMKKKIKTIEKRTKTTKTSTSNTSGSETEGKGVGRASIAKAPRPPTGANSARRRGGGRSANPPP